MPLLIKNIEGSILNNYDTNVNYSTSLSSQIQQSDYINLGGLTAFLQNFTKTEEITKLNKPLTFGLKTNAIFITLNINF